MRVIALITAYNEELMIGPALDHLMSQGAEVYLIDNESTDRTVEIARRYLGRGLLGVETLPRKGYFDLTSVLRREEERAKELPGDWFMHHDADEIRLAPPPYRTLAEGFAEVGRAGYNAVNFQEFVFVPTQQVPNHEHPEFPRTMRHYYCLNPRPLHRLNAWKRTDAPVTLTDAHRVEFPGMRIFPEPFVLKHYICLSLPHAIRKYCGRQYSPAEVERGWHRKRSRLQPEDFYLPDQSELKEVGPDGAVDASEPSTRGLLFEGRRRRR